MIAAGNAAWYSPTNAATNAQWWGHPGDDESNDAGTGR
jgi:hypothetical protein